MKHMTATDGITIHHSDNRLWQTANLHLHIEHIQARYTVITYITAATLYMHVATCTERLIAGTRQNDHTDIQTVTAIVECLCHLPSGQRREGITVALTVDGNLSDMIILLEDDFLEIKTFYLFPFSHFITLNFEF